MLNIIAGTLSSGVPPTPPAVLAYESIATVTLSGSQSSINFTSIPSTFTHLQIRATARGTRVDNLDGIKAQYNSDTGSNYSKHNIQGNGSSTYANGSASTSSIIMDDFMAGSTSPANTFAGFILDILDYANTSKYKTQRGLGGADLSGSGYISFNSGNWRNTNAITSISLTPLYGSQFAQYSKFALYGIKGS